MSVAFVNNQPVVVIGGGAASGGGGGGSSLITDLGNGDFYIGDGNAAMGGGEHGNFFVGTSAAFDSGMYIQTPNGDGTGSMGLGIFIATGHGGSTSDNGEQGGDFEVFTGQGGDYNFAGGIYLNVGQSGNDPTVADQVSGLPGNGINLFGGVGGLAPNATGTTTSGSGGDVSINGGGGNQALLSGTLSGVAGNGGAVTLQGGTGGTAGGATSGTVRGGDGGSVWLIGGTGNPGTSLTSPSATGGNGGHVYLAGGLSASGTTANGVQGMVRIQAPGNSFSPTTYLSIWESNQSDLYIGVGRGFFDMTKISAPSAPPSDTARIFNRDNGSGKNQLCVVFPTGAVQVLATEP